MSRRGLTDNSAANGAGPFLIEVSQLDPQERFVPDLRNRKFNGRPGYFRRFLPFDSVQVTNTSSQNAVQVTYNGQFGQLVPANTQETFSDTAVAQVEVVNIGGSSIAQGEVALEFIREPYDADDAARRERRQGVIAQVTEKFTGVNPRDLLGGGRNGRR